jgi:Bacterial conjugation TrbI-like protein
MDTQNHQDQVNQGHVDQDQVNTLDNDKNSSSTQKSPLPDLINMMGLDLDGQDPVSAFHHRTGSSPYHHDNSPSASTVDTLDAEIISEEGPELSNQEFNPEKNRTKVGLSGNVLAKAALVVGGSFAVLGGGKMFYQGQIPKEAVTKVQSAKSPADEKIDAAQSATVKAQQSESATKAELALSKQKDFLDQASKNDDGNKTTVIDSNVASTNVASNPSQNIGSSSVVPIVPVVRPSPINRRASNTIPVALPQPATKNPIISSPIARASNTIPVALPQPATKNPIISSSIAFAPSSQPTAAKPVLTTNIPNNISNKSTRSESVQTAFSRPLNQSSNQKKYTPTNFPSTGSSIKANTSPRIAPAKNNLNLALQPLPSPGSSQNGNALAPNSVVSKSLFNSFGNPATDFTAANSTGSSVTSNTTVPALIASARIPSEVKINTKSLSGYLSSKSAPPASVFQPVSPINRRLQVVTIPGANTAALENNITNNASLNSPANSVSPNSVLPSLADGIKIAQTTINKPSLVAVAGNNSSIATEPPSLAAGIRLIQELPVVGQVFQVASSDINSLTSLANSSVRPSFSNAKLAALGDIKPTLGSELSKVDDIKPPSNTLSIAKNVLVGTSAKGSTLTPILWNGGASSSAKFIIKLDEAISDNAGQIALPSGSQLIVITKAASTGIALADLEVVSVIINGNEYTAPAGAISVRDDSNGLLIGEDYFKRSEQAANRDFLSILTGAASSVGQVLIRPTSTFSFNSTGGSSTTSNQSPNILGAVLEGGFKDLPATWAQRNQQALQEIAGRPNIYQIPKGKAVRVFVNQTIEF